MNKEILLNSKKKINVYLADNLSLIKSSCLVSIIVSLLAFNQYIITGYTLPDGLCEGYTFYHHGDWHLACGRWFVRYFNGIFGGNIVIPAFVVLMYAAFVALSLLMLAEMFEIKRPFDIGVLSAAMIATPAVIAQLTYPHVYLTFGGAFFFSVLAVFLAWNGKYIRCVLAFCSFILMMGLYQSYLGSFIALIILCMIYDLVKGEKVLLTILKSLKCLFIGIAGCLVDSFIYKKEIEIRGIMASNRVDRFSISGIIEGLPDSIKQTYTFFWRYLFKDTQFKRNILMGLIIAVILIAFVGCVISVIKEKKQQSIVPVIILLLLVAVFPLAVNCIYVVIPYNNIGILMTYHYVLLFFLFFIFARKQILNIDIIKYAFLILLIAVVYFNVIVSNATQIAIKESYRAIETQTRLILDDVFDLEEYVPNETKIAFVGNPSEEVMHNKLDIYQYTSNLPANMVFWKGPDGVTSCREQYLLNYYGIDAGHLTDDDYYAVTETWEFAEMPVWPKKGSVRMINGMAVVRLAEEDYPKRQ